MQIEQLAKLRSLLDFKFSPNGNSVAISVLEPFVREAQVAHIWLFNTEHKQLQQFTTSSHSEYSPQWTPDGKSLSFLSDRHENGSMSIYVMPATGGEASRLFKSKHNIDRFVWSPDGQRLVFLASEPVTESEEQKNQDKDDATVADDPRSHNRLWLYDLRTQALKLLLGTPWQVTEVKWLPGTDKVVVIGSQNPLPEHISDGIYTVNMEGRAQPLVTSRGPLMMLGVAPDGSALSYLGARLDGPIVHDLFVKSLGSEPPANLTAKSIDRVITGYVWRADKSIVAIAADGFRSVVHIIRGQSSQSLGQPATNPAAFDVYGDRMVFAGSDSTHLPEVWFGRIDGKSEQLSNFQAGFDAKLLRAPKLVRYSSFDGRSIEAAYFAPDHAKGSRPPLVVFLHGGPPDRWSAQTDGFLMWAQLLANRGYAVLCPNIRGSTGYGFEFIAALRGDWGGGDFQDILSGIKYLIDQGLADSDRMAVIGHSYGGYLASWAITQSSQFKAAVMLSGLVDLGAAFGTENATSFDEWYLGTPYDHPQRFLERSPLSHVKKVKTPTLILHGELDPINPIGQALQFYRALKYAKVPTQLVVYPREGHYIKEEHHASDCLSRLVEWLGKYLGMP